LRACLAFLNSNISFHLPTSREVFFVPYLWDVIVGALTTSTLEWSREKILVFPLNEDAEALTHENGSSNNAAEKTDFDNTPDVV
jgi:hypothetical protein